MLPSPVTKYIPELRVRKPILELYENRVLNDEHMSNIQYLIEYGDRVFDDLDDVVDLTNMSSVEEKSNMILPKGFIPYKKEISDFISTIKPHNGTASLRRGFYKLQPSPEEVEIFMCKTWRMDVLFNEGPSSDKIYKYACNVGPLVNHFAVCRNLSTKDFINIPTIKADRKEFLSILENETIYISSAELVHAKDLPKPAEPKEVLWFVWLSNFSQS